MTNDEKLDLILEILNQHTEILNEHTETLNQHTEILNEHTEKLNQHTEILNKHSETLKEHTDMLEQHGYLLEHHSRDLADIRLTLENEIRENIRRIAEGHLDLARNLHEAVKPGNALEMIDIRVRNLESDVRMLKQKIS